jgi:hypothetical protein
MKTFFKVLAWLGTGFFILGAIISFYTSWVFFLAEPGEIGVDFGHHFAILLGIPGLVLMLIGGLIAKPHKFWLVCFISGLFYIVSFFEIYLYFPYRIRDGQIEMLLQEIAISILPGLVAIFEGIWMRRKTSSPSDKPVFDGTV